jgi:phosphoglycerate dehydrogenase-like enzyme
MIAELAVRALRRVGEPPKLSPHQTVQTPEAGLDPKKDRRTCTGERMPAPLVIQTERLHPDWANWLAERCTLVRAVPGEVAFEDVIEQAQGIVIRTYTRVADELLARAPALRVVGRAGVGLDNVDLEACARRGVTVVYTPDANTGAVVEYVFAMLFDALRPRTLLSAATDAAGWAAYRREHVAGRQLSDLTLGVYGFGRVGARVARVGSAFGMRVLYHDLLEFPPPRGEAEPVSRDVLLTESDIVSLHVDGRPSNRHLLAADAFGRMKADAVFVNAARGFIIDAHALADWLRANPDALALLDVHEPEPFPADYPLLGLPNARLSPHLAAGTETANRAMSSVVADVWRVLNGEAALHGVPFARDERVAAVDG